MRECAKVYTPLFLVSISVIDKTTIKEVLKDLYNTIKDCEMTTVDETEQVLKTT